MQKYQLVYIVIFLNKTKTMNKDEKVAKKMIKIMQNAGLTPDEMLDVIKLAREKYQQMKIKDELSINKYQYN